MEWGGFVKYYSLSLLNMKGRGCRVIGWERKTPVRGTPRPYILLSLLLISSS